MIDFILNFDFNAFIKAFLAAYGYYAVLILTFLEGETIVLIAGAAASNGTLNPWLVILCAFVGSCTSDQIMFCIGKYFGPKVLKKFPRLNSNVDRASGLIKKYDVLLILGFRFVYGVRNITPIMLGITHVPHLKFTLLNIIGALVWATTFTAAGFGAAKGFNKLREIFGTTALYTILILLAITALILYIRYRQNKKKALELAEKGRKALQAQNSTEQNPPLAATSASEAVSGAKVIVVTPLKDAGEGGLPPEKSGADGAADTSESPPLPPTPDGSDNTDAYADNSISGPQSPANHTGNESATPPLNR